jgi:hypothetical protein
MLILDWSRQAALGMRVVCVDPFYRDEADGDGIQEFSAEEAVGDFGHGVGVDRELNALEKREAACWASPPYLADFGDEGFAEGEDDVAVMMGVLEDRVAEVGIEFPAGGVDDLVVAVEVASEAIKSRIGRLEVFWILIFDWGGRICDFERGSADVDGEAGADGVHKEGG